MSWVSYSGGAGTSEADSKYIRSTRFESIPSGTSGTVTLPASSTVVLDDFGGTVDAAVSTISGGRPTFTQATTSGGTAITTTFDASGNWTFSGTPSAYPVAIIYRVKQLLADFDSDDSSLVGEWDLEESTAGLATTELDNLGTTAVNADIDPSSSGARSLGSSSLQWLGIHTRDYRLYSNTGAWEASFQYKTTLPSGATNVNGIRGSNNLNPVGIWTNDSASTSFPSGSVYIETGNQTAGSGGQDSGDISLQTGTSTNGARGIIKFDALVVNAGTTATTAYFNIDQADTAGAKPVLSLDQGDIDDSFIDFIGTSAADGSRSISTDTTEDSTKYGAIRVEINGTTKWIRIYDNES